MDELTRRAIAAHYRVGNPGQPGEKSGTRDIEGRCYVVLRDEESKVLAVYRLTGQGKLRVLRRWPAEIKAEA